MYVVVKYRWFRGSGAFLGVLGVVLCSSLCSTLKCRFFRLEVSISLVRVQILQPCPGRPLSSIPPFTAHVAWALRAMAMKHGGRKAISEGTWEWLPR